MPAAPGQGGRVAPRARPAPALLLQLHLLCRCEERREARFRREARERGNEIKPGDWYCLECGCVAEEAVARRARDGLPLSAAVMAVCTPECGEARKGRRTAAEKREHRWTAKAAVRRGTAPRGRSS